jgi:ATP-dependent helicase Lhr and Lhr-like helicase
LKNFPLAKKYFSERGWQAAAFQQEAWQKIIDGASGLLNAPTGSGKTYALWFGLIQSIANKTKNFTEPIQGLQILWITPLRSLSAEIMSATQEVSALLNIPVNIVLRTGDTSTTERSKQLKNLPTAMITTPESIHIILSQIAYPQIFGTLQFVVIDEWHELLGTKRGVLLELALSRLRGLNPQLQVWGISATIGNLQEAREVLFGKNFEQTALVQANIKKNIVVKTVLPDELETLPWAGHIGTSMATKVVGLIEKAQSTLVFTNTRAMAEIWYRTILDAAPELAGTIALHHGSLDKEIREWVEEALHDGRLKAVVCTSSLDLGVDFQPVDTVIQIGSPKGVARFMQRAGRSGHKPGATSTIHFVPTHSLEIIEGAAIREAIANNNLESRTPYIRSWDVLCQYLVTLSCGAGFCGSTIYKEVAQTFSYQSITEAEWQWCMQYITKGGSSLEAYSDFSKVNEYKEDHFHIASKSLAMRHRLNIGAIVSTAMLQIKMLQGKLLGVVEEYFISQLSKGDKFWFAGRCLEFIQIKELTVQVRAAKSTKGNIPSYMGGRMPLSSQLSSGIRSMLSVANDQANEELIFLQPLLALQKERSIIPTQNELLVEKLYYNDAHHVFVYPFEGRNTHEGMVSLVASRLGALIPISFSLGMNDYGFHLQSDQEIPIEKAIASGLFSMENLANDTMHTLNAVELSKRRFRDIAVIGGLLFSGFPGAPQKTRHLQANAQLYFQVFSEYEPNNLLFQQAYDEVLMHQLEFNRLYEAFERIAKSKIRVCYPDKPTPFCFPLLTDILRERFTSEDLASRIKKMVAEST